MQTNTQKKKAVIIGAGPAGLTAAYEFLKRTDVVPYVYELSDMIGGIARTVKYKGNRIDIGGHRFFSKSDRVMNWWQDILPLETGVPDDFKISYQGKTREIKAGEGVDADKNDLVMLVRRRISRIFFLRRFFDYPVSLSVQTVRNLGPWRLFKILVSYTYVRIFPIKKEKNLEDFFINRFGRELYLTFFKDYTEKVWGRPCTEIAPDWGAQRIKGLSITKAIIHAAKSLAPKRPQSIGQKGTETSLIERFLYPKHGPGQMWEETARRVQERGGTIVFNKRAVALEKKGNKIVSVTFEDTQTKERERVEGDYFFSTMPVKELMRAINAGTPGTGKQQGKKEVPKNVLEVSEGLCYRDFMTVGLLLNKLAVKNTGKYASLGTLVPDNWIYIQERDVKIGRLQIFNNWSPYMVADPSKVWIGLEYFCNEGDELWSMGEKEFADFAIDELVKIGIIDRLDVLDSIVIKMPKTYPAYFGTYDRFNEIRAYVDKIQNLFLIGRNGMHRYNNQDHSMLTAMVSVDNIQAGITDKTNLWEVNAEQEYHESKK